MDTVIKSNYKRICKACDKVINRGDEVTRCWNNDGMFLRTIIRPEGFYTRQTGNYIVHKKCFIYGIWTDYSAECHSNERNEEDDEWY